MSCRLRFFAWLVLGIHGACCAAEIPLPAARPVPAAQAVPWPHHQVSFERDGVALARLHFDPNDRRPFVFPLLGPAGRSLTRLGHPHDPITHSHHNSVWISHHDVNGVSFWEDRGQGRIVVERVEELEDGSDEAAVVTLAQWRADGTPVLSERRRTAMHLLQNGEWLLIIDLRLTVTGTNAVTLGKTPFGLLGVRKIPFVH